MLVEEQRQVVTYDYSTVHFNCTTVLVVNFKLDFFLNHSYTSVLPS